jgi:hypothetical protein
VNNDKATDQGRINVVELRRILDFSQDIGYALRNELLRELHAKEAKQQEAMNEVGRS